MPPEDSRGKTEARDFEEKADSDEEGLEERETYLRKDGDVYKEVLLIKVESAGFTSGNFAMITMNDVPVEVPNNQNDHQRGLHVLIMDPSSEQALISIIFDTYESSYSLDHFINTYVSRIPEGHIVIAACKDDCSTHMSQQAKQWLADMGSQEVWNLQYRDSFAFIGVHGRNEAVEKRSAQGDGPASVTQVYWQSGGVEVDGDQVEKEQARVAARK